jgi:hypothetical protein
LVFEIIFIVFREANRTFATPRPRLFDGSGNPIEPTGTSSNYIFAVEPTVGS